MWLIVGVLAATYVGDTVAPSPCSSHPEIPELLGKIKECYMDGQPPQELPVSIGEHLRVVYTSKDVIPPHVTCVTAGVSAPGIGYLNLTFSSGSFRQVIYEQQVKDKYILEKDPNGIHFKVYTIKHSQYVYVYYRCIDTEGQNGTGEPMATIYVKFGCEQDEEAKAEVARARECITKLGIYNLAYLPPSEGCGAK